MSDQAVDCCRPDADGIFLYPETAGLDFESIKEGIFLMDCSTELILFIAK